MLRYLDVFKQLKVLILIMIINLQTIISQNNKFLIIDGIFYNDININRRRNKLKIDKFVLKLSSAKFFILTLILTFEEFL